MNSAGIFNIRGKIFQTTTEQFKKLLDINVIGAFQFSRVMEPLMGQGANLIQIGSINGKHSGGGLGAYKSTKAALHMLTRCMAHELARDPMHDHVARVHTEIQQRLAAVVIANEDRRQFPVGAEPDPRMDAVVGGSNRPTERNP